MKLWGREARAVLLVLCAGGCTGLSGTDPALFPEPEADHVTYWGHGCVFIDLDGVGVVTDPVFEKNLWSRRRFVGAPPPDAVDRTQVVLISHAHNDHLSPATLETFPDGVHILCPAPAAKVLSGHGIPAVAMRPGEERDVGGVRFIAVAAHHPGGRWSLDPAADGRALGWVIVAPSATLFYSGDSDYSSTFSDVGWTWTPDIAILNVNGHLLPPDAARAAWATRAPVVIPAHWGAYTYWVLGGSRRPRGEDDLHRLLGDRLHVLEVGEALPIGERAALP